MGAIKEALEKVNEKISAAVNKRSPLIPNPNKWPTLVAVSKFQPVESIIEAYQCGERNFGENYIQELIDKSNDKKILEDCPGIKWHFIGHLQSNKAIKLLKVPNLHMVETIDSPKLASLVNKAFATIANPDYHLAYEKRLKVLIQVKTSDEDSKNGADPNQVLPLAAHIEAECPYLEFAGLMTIGKLAGWGEGQPNHDFIKLLECREEVCQSLCIEPEFLKLSMGMSGDFEEAIEVGSTNVRIGSLIFGERKKIK